MRPAPARKISGKRRILAMIEGLESRQLLTAYLVDTETALAAINKKNLVAGDIVMLKGGTTFSTKLAFDANDKGTAANPIIITSYDKTTKQRLTASAATTARATINAGTGTAISIYNTTGITIEQLNLTGSGSTKNKGSGVDYFADKATNGVNIHHVNASGFGVAGISFGAWGNGSITNIRIENVNAYNNVDGITTYGEGLDLKNLYIGHSKTYNNPGKAGSDNPTGSGILIGGANGATVEYVESYGNGASASGSAGLGIWAYDSNNVLFQYNESHHNTTKEADGGGFDFDGGVTNSVMQYNYSHDNAGSGYGLYQYAGAPTWTNNIIRNNVSVNDGLKNSYNAIDFWAASGMKMSNAQILNNQVVQSKGRYLNLPNNKNITGVVQSGNTFKKSGSVNLTGIGLGGPAV